MIHRDSVERYPGALIELAEEIGDLRYDALAAFLNALAEKLNADAGADARRSRPRLAAALRAASERVNDAAGEVAKAWKIAAPHMKGSS